MKKENEQARSLDTVRMGNERALARLGGAVSAGVLISNSLIKILDPHGTAQAREERKLAASSDLEANVKARGWA